MIVQKILLRKIALPILLFLLFSFSLCAQDCPCLSDFNVLKENVEKNYAGFNDKTHNHSRKYRKATQSALKKTASCPDSSACTQLMKSWLGFFHDHHLYLVDISEVQKEKRAPLAPPSFSKLSEQTLLLKLPSFDYDFKQSIDSILEANHQLITSTPNLVIDLRGNGGGQDFTFAQVIPYLYSGPVVIHSVEIWASEGNIAEEEKSLEKDLPEEVKKDVERKLARMKAHPNTFVNLLEQDTFMYRLDSVYRFPQKIGILIDNKCASSAEEFLLRAKQSRKVTLFGSATLGCLDYSNVRPVWLPSQKRVFALPTSRSVRLPEDPIDKTGIKPDVPLRKNKNPLGFVQQQLEKTTSK
jgi:C-terminal processing protease CtpA/Prc